MPPLRDGGWCEREGGAAVGSSEWLKQAATRQPRTPSGTPFAVSGSGTVHASERTVMDAANQARFGCLYQQHLHARKTPGKRPRTVDAYSRAVRRLRVIVEGLKEGVGKPDRACSTRSDRGARSIICR